MAYALEQIASAASKRLVKDLEQRDELRSTPLKVRIQLKSTCFSTLFHAFHVFFKENPMRMDETWDEMLMSPEVYAS